ncbi:MAG: alpha-amylase family protein [Psychromonas sp.]
MFKKTLLSLSILLTACGGSDGGGDTPPAIPDNIEIEITTAQGSLNQRLDCTNPATINSACDLRIYQIMVESFIDADINADYQTGYGTSHHNGDIAGITASLDYIKALGMNAIWLTPIFESITKDGQTDWEDRLDATGYFTSDYFAIDPSFGTLEQARELVKQAHDRGMYVFFDGVFGHHKGNVEPSPTGLLPTNGTAQASGNEAVYPDDLAFYKEVATYWINELQIDGWRLDQAYQVDVKYWDDIRLAVENASALNDNRYSLNGEMNNPLGYMVAEIWSGEDDISQQAYGESGSPALKSAFDFPMRYSLVQTFAVEESGYGNTPATKLNDGFNTHFVYPDHAQPNLMLGNHDLVRFGDLLQRGQLANPEDPQYWTRHKAALSFIAAYSGPITLYYGDEIGDQVEDFAAKIEPCSGDSGLCDDHVARSSAKIEGLPTEIGGEITVLNPQQKDLKQYVSDLMTIRSDHPALSNGSRTHIHSDNNIYIDRKDFASDHILYLVNTKSSEASVTLSGSAIGSDGDLTNLLKTQTISNNGGLYEITLPAFSAEFYQIVSPTIEGPK